MRYAAKILIMVLIMFLSRSFDELYPSALREEALRQCSDAAAKTAGEETEVTELEVGEAIEDHFEGIQENCKSHYYKVMIPDDLRNQEIGFWIANYADSPIDCLLLDENGWVVNAETGITGNSRRLFREKDADFRKSGLFYRACAGRTYYIKVEKRFRSAKGRCILSAFAFNE